MNTKNNFYLCIYSLSSIVIFVVLLVSPYLNVYISRAIFFIYFILIIVLLFRIFLYNKIFEVAELLNFNLITYIFDEPRIEGCHKNIKWEIHYRDKEAGDDPGILRTYIKLILDKKHDFQQSYKIKKKLKKFRLITIRYIERPYGKQYLLMKVSGFQFSRKDLEYLMDYLLGFYNGLTKKAK
ncbi:hypothetical protein JW930_02460 [Candidatus Woesearchaeota archaeon]|nr:hypothetical protein [Candidatus Woesearchaeota archaeon]